MPRWWFWLFIITIIFGVVYLVLYPGLGKYKGVLNQTNVTEHNADKIAADSQSQAVLGKYMTMDITQVVADPQAKEIGQRLFLNHCAQCHGSDAGGGKSFPNLTDRDWLYGGTPEAIKATITKGRNGVMPSFAGQLDANQSLEVANYVRSLSGLSYDAIHAAYGRATYMNKCAACHGATGTGNQLVGAPNLTDKIWLYGSSETLSLKAF